MFLHTMVLLGQESWRVGSVHTAPVLLLLACSGSLELPGDTSTAPVPDTGDTDTTVPHDTATTEVIDPAPVDTAPDVFAHLPILLVDTDGAITDTVKVGGHLQVIEEHDGSFTDVGRAPREYDGRIGIELHGSSSLGYPKYGYKFECRDDTEADVDCALAGMPEGSDWVLHAPYSDKALVRNALAYSLARDVSGDRWEPRSQLVELVVNGDYVGVYLLVERVSREPDRLDIPPTTDPKDGSVDGGFIVHVDQHRSAGFDTARGTPIDWVTPKSTAVTPDEAAYILGWFDGLEAAMASDTFADTTVGYPAWLDVDAWVDHFLVNELAHNIDAYRLSAYLWTDGPPGASLLRAGPVWDFDRAYGNCNYCESWMAEGWIYDSLDRCGYAYQYPMWWPRLRQDPAFEERLSLRWAELRVGVLSDAALMERIADLSQSLDEAQPRDQARWGTIGAYVDPNYYVGATYAEEVSWLAQWTFDRAAWMDGVL